MLEKISLSSFLLHFSVLTCRISGLLHSDGEIRDDTTEGFQSSTSTNFVERKEHYIELEECGDRFPPRKDDRNDGDPWKDDVERGVLEDEFIYKTVTIDQTYKIMR